MTAKNETNLGDTSCLRIYRHNSKYFPATAQTAVMISNPNFANGEACAASFPVKTPSGLTALTTPGKVLLVPVDISFLAVITFIYIWPRRTVYLLHHYITPDHH